MLTFSHILAADAHHTAADVNPAFAVYRPAQAFDWVARATRRHASRVDNPLSRRRPAGIFHLAGAA